MDSTLLALVEDRLTAEDGPPPEVVELVLAACSAEDGVSRHLDGETIAPPTAQPQTVRPSNARAFLAAVEVAGFRGIGSPARLNLRPGPGLTLVIGRNGSGKSSFAEALEVLLTNQIARWKDRSEEWSYNWRNIHHPEPTWVRAEFTVEGDTQPRAIVRRWRPDAGLKDALREGDPPPGWDEMVVSHRPLLPYSELGGHLDGRPSELYDSLAAMLGLDEIVAALTQIGDARRRIASDMKAARAALTPLLVELAACEDPRAAAAAAALKGRNWDLEAVDLILQGVVDGVDPGREIAALGVLAALSPPSADEVAQATSRLVDAQAALDALAATDAERAHGTAIILEQALRLHTNELPEECSLCGTPAAITPSWRERAARQLTVLTDAARDRRDAERNRNRAADNCRALLRPPPADLSRGAELGVDTGSLQTAWDHWCRAPATPAGLIDHLRAAHGPLHEEAGRVRAAAAAERNRRDDVWRPLAQRVVEWLVDARKASAASAALSTVKAAEAWVKGAAGALRNERFAPIAEQAQANWALLRQQSSVHLDQLGLEGTATRRRLNLGVTIDGAEGSALGVMSQGELNSLALSLFLPRATMAESPFGFMVIDDPVQSMDPSKVDGMARVLEQVARSHQVVVFTHDDRLSAAVSRMQIPATSIEVTRRAESEVALREVRQPWDQALDDARAAVRDEQLPAHIGRHVLPGLCRTAVEAACSHITTARLLSQGVPHAEVDATVAQPVTLMQRLALMLFNDSGRSGDVYSYLNHQFQRWAADTVRDINEGSHGKYKGALSDLVDRTSRLTQRLVSAHS